VPILARTLSPSGYLAVQTDVKELAEEMRETARGCALLKDTRSALDWMTDEPTFPIQTEWEEITQRSGDTVYRFVLQREV